MSDQQNMKDEMRNFVGKSKDVLVNYTLVGTETTLKTIKKEMKEYHEAVRSTVLVAPLPRVLQL